MDKVNTLFLGLSILKESYLHFPDIITTEKISKLRIYVDSTHCKTIFATTYESVNLSAMIQVLGNVRALINLVFAIFSTTIVMIVKKHVSIKTNILHLYKYALITAVLN